MKKEKFFKLFLISITMMILLLGTTCKKSAESDNDINAILSLATQSISDMNKFSSGTANIGNQKSLGFEKQAAAPACLEFTTSQSVSQAITGVVNPSPEHGWMTGLNTVSVNADCSVIIYVASVIDCSLGATMTTGDILRGKLGVSGNITGVSGTVTMSITESSNDFSVNNGSHNVWLIIHAQGTLAGGTLTITGFIDDITLDITKTY